METKYNPSEVESQWHKEWNEKKAFAPSGEGESFSVVIPPPNVTGVLHLGHALNNTIQDILVRYRRKTGRDTLWIPGTDHAGIATQAVVEKKLFEEEGKTRRDVGRDGLVERIWDWKEQCETHITKQLKQGGFSCDWDRQRFTLDPMCAKAVRHSFFNLFQKKLIYRGKRLVNWDTHLQTAVADDEIFYETVNGSMWYFKYELADGSGTLPVATTRPETVLGDTAVAVHPEDPRYKDLIGKKCKVPFVNREIEIIADGMLVNPEFGTGVVKVTPAHDPNDYATGMRHKLEIINLLTDEGIMNENAGPFAGMSIKECREAVVKGWEEAGLLDKIEDHEHQVGHSDRSKTEIQPYMSDQWFVDMSDLAENAMEAVRSKEIKIYPERYEKSYLDWLGEKRDWCISRQLWWGHQIPIWYCEGCTKEDLDKAFGDNPDIEYQEFKNKWLISAREEDLAEDAVPGFKLERDPDALDTWFSSALWPHSTMGWPDVEGNELLAKHYPTSVLVTSRDIITLWVARMVIFSQENMGTIPFKEVYIHPKILDGTGQTMSKSKGNGVDPLDIIEKYGTDALRYVMATMCTDSQDARMPVKPEKQEDGRVINTSDKFEIGRNFANKLWNACRFVQPQMEVLDGDFSFDDSLLALEDKWILSRANSIVKLVTEDIENYKFADMARQLYNFIWDDFCSRYLEIKKNVINSEDNTPEKKNAVAVFASVLNKVLNILNPVMPFITEELNSIVFKDSNLITSAWPSVEENRIDTDVEKTFEHIFAIVEGVRSTRGRYSVSPSQELSAVVSVENQADLDLISANEKLISALAKISDFKVEQKAAKPSFSASVIFSGGEIFIPLEGILDKDAEISRLEKELEKASKFIIGIEKKLSNERFVNNAPEQVITVEKNKLATQKDIVEKCTVALAELK